MPDTPRGLGQNDLEVAVIFSGTIISERIIPNFEKCHILLIIRAVRCGFKKRSAFSRMSWDYIRRENSDCFLSKRLEVAVYRSMWIIMSFSGFSLV
jgi:hypothetical protein